jgi:hypothetical protein
MSVTTIQCPRCSNAIEITSAFKAQIQEQLRQEFEALAKQNEQKLASREQQLQVRLQELQQSQQAQETEFQKRVIQERNRIQEELTTQTRQAIAVEMQQLQTQLSDAKKELTQTKRVELQLRRDRVDLEERTQALELTVARAMDEERGKIREDAKRQADEEHRLKAADHDKLVVDLRRQIGDLKRKAEQGSLQIQGEVLEVELEKLLRDHFPLDVIEPIPVSKNGGDVLHHVVDQAGQRCGTILWEAKRTKSFNDHWLGKLREDLRAARGQVAVLVSMELPKGVTTFAQIDGVWVTSRACLPGLASALRQ